MRTSTYCVQEFIDAALREAHVYHIRFTGQDHLSFTDGLIREMLLFIGEVGRREIAGRAVLNCVC